jgi:asparagine synthase (glutamine-hydrolysing)
MKITIAMLDKKGCNAVPAVLAALKSLVVETGGSFGLASPSTFAIEENIDSLQNKSLDSPIVIGDFCSITCRQVEPRFEELENAMLAFEGRIYSPIQGKSIAENIFRESPQIREKAVEAAVRKAEGDYSLIIAEPDRIVAARDPIGVQPLYYGENTKYVAFASNRKALWKLGIEEPLSFPPGCIGFASCYGCEFKSFKTLGYSKPKKTTMPKAAATLERLLECSVRLRLQDVKEVAVAFSGGLDSSIIAFLAKKVGVNVHLVHVSLKNHP